MSLESRINELVSAIGADIKALFTGKQDTLVSGTNVKTVGGASIVGSGNVDSLDINGGTIDGTVIGGSTPAAGNFNSLSATGAITTNSIKEDAAGNLGLGVVPSAHSAAGFGGPMLQFGGRASLLGSSVYAVLANNVYYGAGYYRYIGTGTASMFEQNAGVHSWYTAPSGDEGNTISTFDVPKMTLDVYGNLQLGRTSRQNSGRFEVTAATSEQAIVAQVASNGNSLYQGFNSGGVATFRVLGNGDVANTNNSYGALSDIKLKENIVDCTPKLAKLLQVRIVNYNLKTDPWHRQIGVVAQELEQISPGLVEETPDYIEVTKTHEVAVPEVPAVEAVLDDEGNEVTPAVEAIPATTKTEEYTEREATGEVTKSVKYSVFVPMLIKAMQEQQSMIVDLQARFTALEAA